MVDYEWVADSASSDIREAVSSGRDWNDVDLTIKRITERAQEYRAWKQRASSGGEQIAIQSGLDLLLSAIDFYSNNRNINLDF